MLLINSVAHIVACLESSLGSMRKVRPRWKISSWALLRYASLYPLLVYSVHMYVYIYIYYHGIHRYSPKVCRSHHILITPPFCSYVLRSKLRALRLKLSFLRINHDRHFNRICFWGIDTGYMMDGSSKNWMLWRMNIIYTTNIYNND